ncbi:transporter particle component [Colletotrichum acutatum]
MANLPTTKSIPGKETPGLRYPSNGKTIYHRPLNRTKTAELSQSSFAYLFSEMVSYAQRNVKDISELEQRLNIQGHSIGLKLLDLLLFREPPRTQTRPLTIITLLHFIKQSCWQHLFGRQADRLEKSADPAKPDEYMIIDNEPLVNAYISVPREMSQLNCAAYVAGIVEGICDGAGFPARVEAAWHPKTTLRYSHDAFQSRPAPSKSIPGYPITPPIISSQNLSHSTLTIPPPHRGNLFPPPLPPAALPPAPACPLSHPPGGGGPRFINPDNPKSFHAASRDRCVALVIPNAACWSGTTSSSSSGLIGWCCGGT